jgi:hypothetical protein
MNFSITNTIVSDNGGVGIFIYPAGTALVRGVINGVTANNNYDGILLDGLRSNLPTVDGHYVTVVNSVAADNKLAGFYSANTSSGTAYSQLVLRNVAAHNNGSDLRADYGGAIYFSHSVIGPSTSGQSIYINGGYIETYGDNQFNGIRIQDGGQFVSGQLH